MSDPYRSWAQPQGGMGQGQSSLPPLPSPPYPASLPPRGWALPAPGHLAGATSLPAPGLAPDGVAGLLQQPGFADALYTSLAQGPLSAEQLKGELSRLGIRLGAAWELQNLARAVAAVPGIARAHDGAFSLGSIPGIPRAHDGP